MTLHFGSLTRFGHKVIHSLSFDLRQSMQDSINITWWGIKSVPLTFGGRRRVKRDVCTNDIQMLVITHVLCLCVVQRSG